MWELFYIVAVLGPGAYLLGRWQFFGKEPARDALIGTLLWSYVMLFLQFSSRQELAGDHAAALRTLHEAARLYESKGNVTAHGRVASHAKRLAAEV